MLLRRSDFEARMGHFRAGSAPVLPTRATGKLAETALWEVAPPLSPYVYKLSGITPEECALGTFWDFAGGFDTSFAAW